MATVFQVTKKIFPAIDLLIIFQTLFGFKQRKWYRSSLGKNLLEYDIKL